MSAVWAVGESVYDRRVVRCYSRWGMAGTRCWVGEETDMNRDSAQETQSESTFTTPADENSTPGFEHDGEIFPLYST